MAGKLVWLAGVLAVLGLLAMAPAALAAGSGVPGDASAASAGLRTNEVVADLAREGVGVYGSPKSRRPLRHVSPPLVPILTDRRLRHRDQFV